MNSKVSSVHPPDSSTTLGICPHPTISSTSGPLNPNNVLARATLPCQALQCSNCRSCWSDCGSECTMRVWYGGGMQQAGTVCCTSVPQQMLGAISNPAFQVRSGQIPAGCLKWSLMTVLTSVMPSQHGGILPKVSHLSWGGQPGIHFAVLPSFPLPLFSPLMQFLCRPDLRPDSWFPHTPGIYFSQNILHPHLTELSWVWQTIIHLLSEGLPI